MEGAPIERHEVAGGVLRPPVRRVRGEPDRTVDGELEARRRELDARAGFETLGQHADEPRGRLGGVALQLDVDAVRVAAANASPRVGGQGRVPGGAFGDRDTQVGQGEGHGPPSLPGFDQRQQPLAQCRWAQRAAGEEHGVDRHPIAQEGGQVPAHRGVGRVGQADLEQPHPPRPGQFIDRRQRKETVEHDRADLGGGDRGVERGGEQRGAFARNRNVQRRARVARGPGGGQNGLLELPRLRQQVTPLPPRQPFVGVGLELALHRVRQSEIDVVAAEQQVVAGGDPLDRRRPAGRARGAGTEQAEVGGAAADVADEDGALLLRERRERLLAPGVAGGVVEPGIERGLRLLQQAQRCGVAGQARRLARQRLRRFVERGGDGDDDPLRFEHALRVVARDDVVPRRPQVAEKGRAGLHRRELEFGRNLVRAERQQARLAVDARVREPGLGRVDDPARLRSHPLAGQRPDEIPGGFLERRRRDRIELPVVDLARRRIAEERRQQRARTNAARGVELRDLQYADRRRAVGEVEPGQRAVGRSEVDADGVAGRSHPTLPRAARDPARRSRNRA